MRYRRSVSWFFILMVLWVSNSCISQEISTSIDSSPTINSEKAIDKPYLLLISLDGFRWDYVERFKPPHLSRFINDGVKAESLIPSFPSKTFPNHYTIATGMYPDKHGILGNLFYSYEKDTTYSIRKRELVEDGSFYGGNPIWVQAAKSGMVTASYFFVGTESDIQGVYPTYYYKYDGSIKSEEKVSQVLRWFSMPEETRPHFITMYFPDMDNTGHAFGPNNDDELKKSLYNLDLALGELFDGINKSGLPVNIVIVSDHGMKEVPVEKYIPEEKILNEELYRTVSNGSIVNIHPYDDDNTEAIYKELKSKEENFKVFRTEETPFFEYIPQNKDWGTIQIVPMNGYYFSQVRIIGYKKNSDQKVFGHHGFDPDLKDMHGIFYANGPAFKERFIVPSVKNIHVYPLMCKILGLEIPEDIDGKLEELKSVLKE